MAYWVGTEEEARSRSKGDMSARKDQVERSFRFFVTNTYNIIIMVTKVKYNIIATNKSKLYEMFIDLK